MSNHNDDIKWMLLAVELEKHSKPEGKNKIVPKVAAVLVRDGQLLGTAYRGKHDPRDHAEFCLLERDLKGVDLKGATLYTTLEPCSSRGPDKIPCAHRVVAAGISDIVIGIYDPNPVIYREGWRILREAGVKLRSFPVDLRMEVRADNADFLDTFRLTRAEAGAARFDYVNTNGGNFVLGDGDMAVVTHWTKHSSHGIYAYTWGSVDGVAIARHCKTFDEVDDPLALHFNTSVEAHKDEIVVFRTTGLDCALVMIKNVLAGPTYGAPRHELEFAYEIWRPLKRTTG
jgi:diaminohydroxyphosphoribosylaminopyrimidine deaminase/5-amino-6-(5-phosphoribosylamino)uracil reductase